MYHTCGCLSTAKYNIVGGYTGNDAWADGVLDVKIYGGATADPMSLTIKVLGGYVPVSVSTADVFFPLTWRQNVSLYDGEYTMAYQYKMMPGHIFTIGEGATAIINKLIVYTQAAMNSFSQPTNVAPTHYRNDAGDAQCIIENGGKLIIGTKNSSGGIDAGSAGGNITQQNGGVFEFTAVNKKFWTCTKCSHVIYSESKPSSCPNSKLFDWHTKFTEGSIKNTSVTSIEASGVSDNIINYSIVLDLSVNGVKV